MCSQHGSHDNVNDPKDAALEGQCLQPVLVDIFVGLIQLRNQQVEQQHHWHQEEQIDHGQQHGITSRRMTKAGHWISRAQCFDQFDPVPRFDLFCDRTLDFSEVTLIESNGDGEEWDNGIPHVIEITWQRSAPRHRVETQD